MSTPRRRVFNFLMEPPCLKGGSFRGGSDYSRNRAEPMKIGKSKGGQKRNGQKTKKAKKRLRGRSSHHWPGLPAIDSRSRRPTDVHNRRQRTVALAKRLV